MYLVIEERYNNYDICTDLLKESRIAPVLSVLSVFFYQYYHCTKLWVFYV